ncbi:MAG TPA: putative toxin-antitoxin system toxin component, PIN family [Patescibacteria group bacterium]|nr:putative toxin-antitoxin system toxin component, PIN family [Patescibacteria group bacterium]
MKKEKLRVILDTNVIISATHHRSVNPIGIFKLVILNKVEGFISEEIIAEILGVLEKKFGFKTKVLAEIEASLREDFTMVYPIERVNVVRDPDDNKFIEAAVEGKCSYIVSGDRDLLDLKKYKNIKILNPAEFLKEFEK